MEFDTSSRAPVQRKPRLLRLLLSFSIAFVAGIGAMGWGLSRWDGARNWLFGAPVAQRIPAITYTPAPALPAPSLVTPDLAARMAELEGRVAKVEAAGGTSGGNSARAEGLLVSFAARRAIDRGLGLGYVEGLLNQRFAATQPRAVATIIAAARQPVTLEQLRAGLDAVAPELVAGGPDEGWWAGLKRGFSSVLVVREAGSASPDPNARIARARLSIESGRVDLALAEVARLPNRDKATAWIAMARRYVESHRALDLLEAAAITSSDSAPTPILPAEPVKPTPEPAESAYIPGVL
jgi:hypothetical protein